MQHSIWQNVKLKEYPSLNENQETEILVIGGGICGILCAYYLSFNHQVMLVEAERIAGGRTGKTTAVITALQDVYYKDLIRQKGKQAAKDYLQANLDAIEAYEKLSFDFDFDFERVSSYKYFQEKDETLKKEMKCIQELGFPAQQIDTMIEFPNQAQMNPLKLIANLLDNFSIYENTKIIAIKNQVAYTKEYAIQAKHIIVATGYPFLKLKGLFPLKLTQKKSFVTVIENVNEKNYNAVGSMSEDLYFRTYKHYLIIGGNDQKTGKQKKSFVNIINHIEKNYPNSRVLYQWVNQDCVTLDDFPYIGRYGMSEHVYVATGFNLWGMTGSMIAAKILVDRIEKRNNDYAYLFNPKRTMSFLPLCKNISTVLCNFFKFKKRCSHLGCALYFNKEEGVYECPCHGSKYSAQGDILFNPAQTPIDIKK